MSSASDPSSSKAGCSDVQVAPSTTASAVPVTQPPAFLPATSAPTPTPVKLPPTPPTATMSSPHSLQTPSSDSAAASEFAAVNGPYLPVDAAGSSSATHHSRPQVHIDALAFPMTARSVATVQSLTRKTPLSERSMMGIVNRVPQLTLASLFPEEDPILLESGFDCTAGAGLRLALRQGHAYQVARTCNDIVDLKNRTVRVPTVEVETMELLAECDLVQFASILVTMADAYRLHQDGCAQDHLQHAFVALNWARECMETELRCDHTAFAAKPSSEGALQVKLGDEVLCLNKSALDGFDAACMKYASRCISREGFPKTEEVQRCIAAWAGRVYSLTLQHLAGVIQHDLVASFLPPAFPPTVGSWDTAEQLVSACVAVQCSSLMRDNWEAWVTLVPLAEHALDRQQYGRAERLYFQSLSLLEKSSEFKNNSPTRVAYARLLRYLGQLYIVVAHQSPSVTPSTRAMIEKAAIPALVKSTQYHPSSDETLSDLGSCHALLGNYAKALEFYQAAVNLKPNNVNRLLDLAALYISKGDKQSLQAARRIYEKHLFKEDGQFAMPRLVGPQFSSYHNLVTVYRELGDFDHAIKLLQMLHAQFPSCLSSYQVTRTISDCSTRDHVELLFEHIKYLQDHQDHLAQQLAVLYGPSLPQSFVQRLVLAQLYYTITVMYVKHGWYEEAAAACSQVLARLEDDIGPQAQMHRLLGDIFYDDGKLAEAVVAYNKAAEMSDDSAAREDLRTWIAVVTEQLSQPQPPAPPSSKLNSSEETFACVSRVVDNSRGLLSAFISRARASPMSGIAECEFSNLYPEELSQRTVRAGRVCAQPGDVAQAWDVRWNASVEKWEKRRLQSVGLKAHPDASWKQANFGELKDFVVMPTGRILVGSRHSYLANYGQVRFAGSIRFVSGAITFWTNTSGHYRIPSLPSFIKDIADKFHLPLTCYYDGEDLKKRVNSIRRLAEEFPAALGDKRSQRDIITKIQ